MCCVIEVAVCAWGSTYNFVCKGGDHEMTHSCPLCNEAIDEKEIQFGEVKMLGDEYWHLDCYAEYFDEVLEEV